jgi:hypothetical protein
VTSKIALTYDGDIASLGKMRLYEYGRSQYAFSRILTTVEQYRRTRQIIDRVTSTKRVDLIVTAPRRGSFRLDVDVDSDAPAAAGVADFETLFALVLDRLIPMGEEFSDLAASLARIRHREVSQAANVDQQLLQSLDDLAAGEVYDPKLVLDTLEWAINSSNRAIARADISQDEIERAFALTKSDIARQGIIKRYRGQVNIQELNVLTAKVRTIFNELAVPLGKSADIISIGTATAKRKFYHFDRKRLDFINARDLDAEEIELWVKIKNFDVESATGSMRIDGAGPSKRFNVDPAAGQEVRTNVVLAMNQAGVDVVCVVYKDSNGIVTSYMIKEVNI